MSVKVSYRFHNGIHKLHYCHAPANSRDVTRAFNIFKSNFVFHYNSYFIHHSDSEQKQPPKIRFILSQKKNLIVLKS